MIKGILLLLVAFVDPSDVGKVNAAKADAKKAYLAGDYKTAAVKYSYLADSMGVREDEVMMNLANAYFHLADSTNASNAYQQVLGSKNTRLKSLASQQLGVLNNREGKFEEALNYFKQALKADPTNDEARFNYEMLKKKLEEKKKEEQQKQQQNQDQKKDDQEKDDKDSQDKQQDQQQKDQKQKDSKDKKDQEQKDQEKKEKSEQEKKDQEKKDQEEKDSEKENKETPKNQSDKLKERQMSEEKAKMILDAMRNQEVQYLQQNKRKASQPKDKTKPDW